MNSHKPIRKFGSRIEPWRLLLALAVVGAVVSTLWLWGRPQGAAPQTAVVVTSEYWFAGTEPAGFHLAQLPTEIASRFLEPAELVGRIAAVDIPPGVYVAATQLSDNDVADGAGEGSGETTFMNFGANYEPWWPTPPAVGDWAVVATKQGGCALHVLQLAGVGDSTVTFAVDHSLAVELSEVARLQSLVLWKSPTQGWPACDGDRVAPVNSSSPASPSSPASSSSSSSSSDPESQGK